MKRSDVPGVVLAGGRSSRMGVPNKCLLTVGGTTILAHVIVAVRPQLGSVLINSNSDPALFAQFGLPVRADILPGRLGPLAGVHTAMLWARDQGHDYVATVPGDTPFLPDDLLVRMKPLRQYGRPVILSDGTRVHPTIGLWPVKLADRLGNDIQAGITRMQQWCKTVPVIEALYLPENAGCFLNLNTAADLECAQNLASASHPGFPGGSPNFG